MRVKEWKVENQLLSGHVFGSDKYPDGAKIQTSQIVTAAVDDGIFMIRTENSIYECHGKDFVGTEMEMNDFLNWCMDVGKQNTRWVTQGLQ